MQSILTQTWELNLIQLYYVVDTDEVAILLLFLFWAPKETRIRIPVSPLTLIPKGSPSPGPFPYTNLGTYPIPTLLPRGSGRPQADGSPLWAEVLLKVSSC